MKTELHFTARTAHRRSGHEGSTAIVHVGNRWPHRYVLQTHGKKPEDIAAAVRRLEAHHAEKEARIEEYQGIVGRHFVVKGDHFRIMDATVRERGNGPELVLQVARQDGSSWKPLEGMPLKIAAGTMGGMPRAAEVEVIARQRAATVVAREAAHEDFVAQVTKLLGGAS